MQEFEVIELIKENVKVTWEYIGEGWNGDYNPEDPNDIPLLRFTVYEMENDEWVEVSDSSYCTCFPLTADVQVKIKGLETIMNAVFEKASAGKGIKQLCEKLSHIDETCTVTI